MNTKFRWVPGIVCGVALVSLFGGTGCTVYTGGQTLPSAYYLHDDVQYHAPGPEFKLAREAAAIKAYNVDQAAQEAQRAVQR